MAAISSEDYFQSDLYVLSERRYLTYFQNTNASEDKMEEDLEYLEYFYGEPTDEEITDVFNLRDQKSWEMFKSCSCKDDFALVTGIMNSDPNDFENAVGYLEFILESGITADSFKAFVMNPNCEKFYMLFMSYFDLEIEEYNDILMNDACDEFFQFHEENFHLV